MAREDTPRLLQREWRDYFLASLEYGVNPILSDPPGKVDGTTDQQEDS